MNAAAQTPEDQAQAWIAATFVDTQGDWQSRFSAENMEAAFAAGFAASNASTGMSKREHMAAATLAGIMPWALSVNMSAEGIAQHAVSVADGLLLRLASHPEELGA